VIFRTVPYFCIFSEKKNKLLTPIISFISVRFIVFKFLCSHLLRHGPFAARSDDYSSLVPRSTYEAKEGGT